MVYMSNTGKKHYSGWEEGDWSWRNMGVEFGGGGEDRAFGHMKR